MSSIFFQVLLESHLFSNLPKTVKSCVDFVAEQIASDCVKEICKNLIPKIKTDLNEELRKEKQNEKVVRVEPLKLPICVVRNAK